MGHQRPEGAPEVPGLIPFDHIFFLDPEEMPKRSSDGGTMQKSKRRKSIRPSKAAKGRPKATGAFAKRVRTVLFKEAETKLKVLTFMDQESIPRSGLQSTNTGKSMDGKNIPNLWGVNLDHESGDGKTPNFFALARGTEQEQFIGNQISDPVINFRGFVTSKPWSSTNNSVLPYEFHILVYKNKLSPAVGNPNGILSAPNNELKRITGTASDSMFAWNRDGYVIKKHMVMRMRPRMKTLSNDSVQNGDLSNAPVFRRFGFRVKLKKVLKFPDSQTYPDDPDGNVSIGMYVLDGSGNALGSDQSRCTVSLVGALRFKDY